LIGALSYFCSAGHLQQLRVAAPDGGGAFVHGDLVHQGVQLVLGKRGAAILQLAARFPQQQPEP